MTPNPKCPHCVTHPKLRPSGWEKPAMVCPVCKRGYTTNGEVWEEEFKWPDKKEAK